jgi:ribosome-binding protein aMBF1 (putative translation factor)
MAAKKHCWKCGTEWAFARLPGRNDTCDTCGSDLKVCLNCVSYDRKVAYECRDRRAEEIAQKDRSNFCEYFDMARREFVPQQDKDSREDKARDQLKKLFGD